MKSRTLFYSIFVLVIFGCQTSSQNKNQDISKQFKKARKERDYNTIRNILTLIADTAGYSPKTYMAFAETYLGEYNLKSAKPYFYLALNNDECSNIDSAKTYSLKAICHFLNNEKDSAKWCFSKTLRLDNSSEAIKHVEDQKDLLGLSSIYDSWTDIKIDGINFKIQHEVDCKIIESKVSDYNLVYDSLQRFFGAQLPKAIDYFIWKNKENSKAVFGKAASFANSRYLIIHGNKNNSLGHELTHIMVSQGIKPINVKRLINEGIAVYLDFADYWSPKVLKKVLKYRGIEHLDMEDLWISFKNYDNNIGYTVGGMLIEQFISIGTKEELFQLLKNQTIDNAQTIYGMRYDVALANIEGQLFD